MDSLVARYLELAGGGERAMEVLPIQAFARGDARQQAEVLERLESAPDITLEVAMYSVASFGGSLDGAERIARVLTASHRSPALQGMGHLWAAHALLAGGRWREAAAEIDRARGLSSPSYVTYYRVLARLLPWVPATDAELEALLAEARTLPAVARIDDVDPSVGHQGVEPHARTVLIGLLEARLGRPGVVRAAAELEALGGTLEAGTLGVDLARMVEGYAAWLRGDTPRALARFEAMPMQSAYPLLLISDLYSHGFARYLRARTLQDVGRVEEAERWYGSLSANPYELVYRGPVHLHLAEMREQAGDREGAIEHYRAFIDLWKDADPELQPMVEEARAALARLGATST
jgi:tetratricopeptide (TPR) repeat protein